MCFVVQRRLSTVVRIFIAVGFLAFIMCKYFYAAVPTRDRITVRLFLSICLSICLLAPEYLEFQPEVDF